MLHIPFYPNSKDNSHCYQSVLKMVLKYYYPKETHTLNQLDKVTNHRTGLWTWDSAGLMYLADLGFDVIEIENFDYTKFGQSGMAYLRTKWSTEVCETQQQHCDLKSERKLALRLSRHTKVRLLKRPATMKDIRSLFKKGFLVMPTVNPYTIDHMIGYGSHLVLITNITEKYIYYHDPGIPAVPNRKVSIRLFRKAFVQFGNIKAVRK